MRTKLLFLIPMLAFASGCSESIEAQESGAPASETASEQETKGEEAQAAADEVELKLQAPVAID